MSASALEHKSAGPHLLSGCAADCPACAEQVRIDEGVREIVFGMWLQAIADGERSVEQALREVEPLIGKLVLHKFVRSDFTQRALEIKPRKTRRKPRGLPTAWRKANHDLVDTVKRHEGLPANHVGNSYSAVSVFDRVAAIWHRWGIPATQRQVQDNYYALGD